MGQARRLAAVNPAAAALGLAPGLPLADARARFPDLAAAPADPVADARLLERLATRMAAFSPLVALDPPDGLLLDITGAAHLFGGEAAMAAAVVAAAVAACGSAARPALADHAAAARALARFGAGAAQDVRCLPVAALEPGEEVLAALASAGLVWLGDLAARPMAPLAARFGEGLVRALRAILGEVAPPLIPWRTLPPIHEEARFAEPIARTQDALAVIEALLLRAGTTLQARAQGGRRFIVELERGDGLRRRLAVETGQPTQAPAPVMRLLRERIETLADPLDPGFGFDTIRLAVGRTQSLPPRQIDTAGTAAEAGDISALIDRLSLRLGADAVCRLAPVDTHVPEAAQRLLPAREAPPQAWDLAPAALPRPLLLFDPPQPVAVIASVPDGPPLRFRWQGQLHEVRLAEGPERIAPEWWHAPDGQQGAATGPGHALSRDYYRVEDAGGRRFWLLRHGLFGETEAPLWYVHGLCA